MATEQGRPSLDTAPRPQTPDQNRADTSSQRLSAGAPSNNADNPELQAKLDAVLLSDIGVEILLGRLKQSISSARDFSSFLKERFMLEDKHAQGLKRLARITIEGVRRSDNRQGTYARGLEELTFVNDRIAENGIHFANSLYNMSEELRDLAENTERGRKQWKHNALDSEKRVQEAEHVMMRSKDKYYGAAEQYDRAKAGERQSGKFNLKSKSAAQQEESLREKVDQLDHDYSSKVDAAQAQKRELVTRLRPEAVRNLSELIQECDAGVSYQMQKFVSLNEKHMVGNGVAVSPLKGQGNAEGAEPKSLRQTILSIDNHRDFNDYILGFSQEAPQPSPIKYEKHPTLIPQNKPPPQSQAPPAQQSFGPPQQQQSFGPPQHQQSFGPPQHRQSFGPSQPPQSFGTSQSHGVEDQFGSSNYRNQPTPGQISGVAPYEHTESNQNNQFDQHQPTPQDSRPPQLPQIGGGEDFRRSFEQGSPSAETPIAAAVASHQRVASGQGPPRGPVSPVSPQYQPPGGAGRGFPPGPGLAAGAMAGAMMGAGRGGPPPNMGMGPGPQSRPPQQNGPNGQPWQGGYGPPRGPSGGPPPGMMGGPHPGMPGNAGPNRGLPSQQYPGMGGRGMMSPGGGPMPGAGPAPGPGPMNNAGQSPPNLPPLRPVFGISLDELFRRDGSAVPSIVYQCIRAVESFGLNTPFIYRNSGSAPFIQQLKAKFDHDATRVDLARGPSEFNHDIAAVATLLKNFLRDLPDPVFTAAAHRSLIQSAKIDDDTVRRDSLHQIINSLPDPNYATLRVLVLHLNRVAMNAERNQMSTADLSICFAPTLIGGQDMRDAQLQARVIQTVLDNTLQIFDDDD